MRHASLSRHPRQQNRLGGGPQLAGAKEFGLDALAMLRLQIEWGADEALDPHPVDRRRGLPASPAPRAEPPSQAGAQAPAPSPVPRPAAVTAGRGGQAQAAREAAASATDLPGLRAAITGFDGCGLRDTATHLVFAEGDAAAGLVIVGEVPDAEEDRAGHPFAGRPGLLLDRMLESIGLDRHRLLLVPLIPWRPPGDRRPSDFEIATCLPFLERLLVLAAPGRMILMGSRPAKLLGASTIRSNAGWQSLEIDGRPTPTLAMRHPSYLLSHPMARRDSWADLLLLRRTLDAEPERAPAPVTAS